MHQGIRNKIEKLLSITTDLSEVAYVGDDINDMSCMESVKAAGGFVGCPANAVKIVINIADFVNSRNGAIRDFIEWLVDKGRCQ